MKLNKLLTNQIKKDLRSFPKDIKRFSAAHKKASPKVFKKNP